MTDDDFLWRYFFRDSIRCPDHNQKARPDLYRTDTYTATIQEIKAEQQMFIDCPHCVAEYRSVGDGTDA